MANLNKDIENKANGQAHNMDDKIQSVGQTIQKYSHDIGANIGSTAGDLSARANNYVKSSRTYVEENPIQSVAIAAAAGLIFGSFLTKILGKK